MKFDSDTDFVNFCQTRLSYARGVLWMLLRTFNGEVDAEARVESDVAMAIQFVTKMVDECDDIEHYPDALTNRRIPEEPHFFTELSAATGIANTLDAMIWSDGLKIVGSDAVMSDLLRAIDHCVGEALTALDVTAAPATTAEVKAPEAVNVEAYPGNVEASVLAEDKTLTGAQAQKRFPTLGGTVMQLLEEGSDSADGGQDAITECMEVCAACVLNALEKVNLNMEGHRATIDPLYKASAVLQGAGALAPNASRQAVIAAALRGLESMTAIVDRPEFAAPPPVATKSKNCKAVAA